MEHCAESINALRPIPWREAHPVNVTYGANNGKSPGLGRFADIGRRL